MIVFPMIINMIDPCHIWVVMWSFVSIKILIMGGLFILKLFFIHRAEWEVEGEEWAVARVSLRRSLSSLLLVPLSVRWRMEGRSTAPLIGAVLLPLPSLDPWHFESKCWIHSHIFLHFNLFLNTTQIVHFVSPWEAVKCIKSAVFVL